MNVFIILIVTTLLENGEIERIEETRLSSMEVCEKWRDDILDMGNHYKAECVRRIQIDL